MMTQTTQTTQEFIPARKNLSKTDRIHDQILEIVIKNASDEELVLNEKRLVELFGVSKAPVREALIRLCSEGVLHNVPRYGYVAVRMSERDARDVVQMRILLETEGLKQSFAALSEQKLALLKEQIERASSKQNVEIWDVWNDNEEFHLLLASFADNKILNKLLEECMELQKRIYAQQKWNRLRTIVDSVVNEPHYQIYQKLAAGKLEEALQCLRQDITGSEPLYGG